MFRYSTKQVCILSQQVPNILCRTAGTTVAANVQDVLPFSAIPKLPTIPFVGSGWVYLPVIGPYDFWRLHKANHAKYLKYGPIVREQFSKDFSVVLLFDHKEVAKVYRAEGQRPERRSLECIKKYRDQRKDVFKNGGLLTTQGQKWYEIRSQTQPHMMKPKSVHAYTDAMDEVVQSFIKRMIFLRGKNGGEVPDYLNELYKWSLESVGLVAVDARLGCLEINPKQETINLISCVNKIFKQMMSLEFSNFNLYQKIPTPTWIKFVKNMDYFTDTVYKFILEAHNRLKNAPPDREPTFLEMMLTTTKDPKVINAMITDMFFGGIDTTSSTVGFTLYHLARNPEVQEKAYQEVQKVLKGGNITVDVLNEMRYLKACVKESMRLTPVAIGNMRAVKEDIILCGYEIPAGTQIFVQGYTIGLLEDQFPEPHKYRPERFMRDESAHDPFAFLPFGFGPRQCIGKRIAEQEIWTLLIRLLQKFRVEYHYDDIDLYTRGPSMPDKPLRFQFFDR